MISEQEGGISCSTAIPWMQATVPAGCCILRNARFDTTSAGYTGQDVMNVTKPPTLLIVMAADSGVWDATLGLCRVQSRLWVGFISVAAQHRLYLWVNAAPFLSVGVICQAIRQTAM